MYLPTGKAIVLLHIKRSRFSCSWIKSWSLKMRKTKRSKHPKRTKVLRSWSQSLRDFSCAGWLLSIIKKRLHTYFVTLSVKVSADEMCCQWPANEHAGIFTDHKRQFESTFSRLFVDLPVFSSSYRRNKPFSVLVGSTRLCPNCGEILWPLKGQTGKKKWFQFANLTSGFWITLTVTGLEDCRCPLISWTLRSFPKRKLNTWKKKDWWTKSLG